MSTQPLMTQKRSICAAAFLATTLLASAQLSEDFETYTLNSDIDGQGGWTTAGTDADAHTTISNTEAASGSFSLFVVDNSASQRPRAIYDFPEAISNAEFSFSIKEDQSDASTDDYWSVKFGNFSFSRGSTKLVLTYEGSNPKEFFNTTINSTSYSTTDWNHFSILFNGDTGSATISLGGATIISASDPSYAWSSSRVEIGAYSSGGDTDAFYVDSVSMSAIPEPSSFAGTIGIFVLGLGLFRRNCDKA